MAWSADATGPRRFVSVHGRRAAILGYSEAGLEVWAYPFQILTAYAPKFRPRGSTTAIDGRSIFRRVIYTPEGVTRIYAGPDFIVRERLFAPLDEPAAIIDYEVDGTPQVDIEIGFKPVLDLMWPGGIGGQEVTWNSAASAYLLSEATHRVTARIGSPAIVDHDETPNDSQAVRDSHSLAFTIATAGKGDHKTARVIICGSTPEHSAEAIAAEVTNKEAALERSAEEHYSDLLSRALRVETPDAVTNRALAWAEIALDQAWVCNRDIGCGLVAGYGPSRKARRPQYDWFFAGDGMVAVQALLGAGQYDRAREELEFIIQYQDQKSGMIWHEISQSAGWIDWKTYPYMYVHVDLTFDFINTMASYYVATGNLQFVKAHWPSIQAAYDYCRSILDSSDSLPRIPAGKEGSREQDALADELALSINWADVSRSFALLAAAAGNNQAADQARAASQRAVQAISTRYWDEQRNSWITGFNRSGAAVIDRDLGPAEAAGISYFSAAQRNALLDQLSSSDFQTDWGTRGKPSNSSTYNPNSYSSGSVWATGSSGAATLLWAAHRPATAFPIWRALVDWSSLDSLGHMHEALAGDYYHEEEESVPEQTWSSAAFFSAAVNGLLGLRVDAASRSLTFAPHLPPNWNAINLRNIHGNTGEVNIAMTQGDGQISLVMENKGEPLPVVFNPEIPLGAQLQKAELERRAITATIDKHPQDLHAKVEFKLPHGSSEVTIYYSGGITISPQPTNLMVGEPGKSIKITGVSLRDDTYTVSLDYLPSSASTFEVRTPWTITNARGATYSIVAPGVYKVSVAAISSDNPRIYQHGEVTLTVARHAPHQLSNANH